jgi:hypothetical protein
MSPLATYVYKGGPKSWRGIQKITKYSQKYFFGKVLDSHFAGAFA